MEVSLKINLGSSILSVQRRVQSTRIHLKCLALAPTIKEIFKENFLGVIFEKRGKFDSQSHHLKRREAFELF
jgi:hypothetical protein